MVQKYAIDKGRRKQTNAQDIAIQCGGVDALADDESKKLLNDDGLSNEPTPGN